MAHQFSRRYSLFLLVLTLWGCQENNQSVTSAATDASPTIANSPQSSPLSDPPTETSAETKPKSETSAIATSEPNSQPVTYCFEKEDEITDLYTRLIFDGQSQLSGDVQGIVHNEEAGYFTSYRQKVTGVMEGQLLKVKLTTWIEYDQQFNDETWQFSPKELVMPRTTLTAADCGEVNKAFQDENGLEGSNLTEFASQPPEQVQFAAGTSSITLSDSVVRGDRKLYKLGAQGGQLMDLSITSLEDNAVFDVIGPTGDILSREQTRISLPLPHTGDYQVVVGGTRGNTSFELTVAIP